MSVPSQPCATGMTRHVFVRNSKVCAVCWTDLGEIYTPPAAPKKKKPKAQRTPGQPRPILPEPCAYCGGQADSRDHLLPYARGGRRTPENMVPACQPCNNNKGDRTPLEWLGDLCPPKWRDITPRRGDAGPTTNPKKLKPMPDRIVAHLTQDANQPPP